METRETEEIIEELCSPATSPEPVPTLGGPIDEVGSLEVAFLYDAPMREMTVRIC